MLAFEKLADICGSRLRTVFDSIPAGRYEMLTAIRIVTRSP
jgi:hypothetical protein